MGKDPIFSRIGRRWLKHASEGLLEKRLPILRLSYHLDTFPYFAYLAERRLSVSFTSFSVRFPRMSNSVGIP